MRLRKELDWYVGYSMDCDTQPDNKIVAVVPGAVQLDWQKSQQWDSYTYSDNYKNYYWMEDAFWHYSTRLELPCINEGESLIFVCKGVDYKFIVKFNGEVIHEQEGMFTPFEVDLTSKVSEENILEIVIFPAPKRAGAEKGRAEADHCCKPAVSYGWDWHPRLIPLGIWDDTYLEVRPKVYIKKSEVHYSLNDDFSVANVFQEVELSKKDNTTLRWQVLDSSGRVVIEKIYNDIAEKNDFSGTLEKPELWWPNGQGEPTLYLSKVQLYDSFGNLLDEKEARIGFRSVKLIMHPGAWESPKDFPKSRSNPPITLEINGRSIFCKGSNWVNPEIFPGTITEDTYRPLLNLAKEANMNMLRSWGGGIINKESFFNLCDELGIMVWQEFPLACNNYVGTSDYLKILDQESKSIIRRLRSHASVVMWCGGNELFNAWSGMTEQSLALRLLDRNCFDLDPNTPFIMTSPLMGMAHGNYVFRDENGQEVYEQMAKADNTAYTEFGCPGPSDVEYLKGFIPENELFPPQPGTAWETHHGFGAWVGDTWLMPEVIEHYFGRPDTLEELVGNGQLLQSEGYKCIFEEARRQKPKCSMALNWCYNEPWPTAANNSLVNWPSKPKPAYFAVQASCRPVLASARISKFSWSEGEIFNPELWILNDSPNIIPADKVEVFLRIDDEDIFLLAWEYPRLKANTNLCGPIIRFPLPAKDAHRMVLVLKAAKCEEMSSEYILVYNKRQGQNAAGSTRLMNM